MQYIIIAVLAILLLFFIFKYFVLRRAIQSTTKQLNEICDEIEENRITRLLQPGKEMESLQTSINRSLCEVRDSRIEYQKQEKEFKQQIENISHDLRTPLTSIHGYLRLIDRSKLSIEDQESLTTVERKADALQNLITQFYDFSRLTAEDYRVTPIRIDISRFLREMVTDAYKELANRQLDVQVNIPDKPIYALCDENATTRVFQNLLQNAIRYAVSNLEIHMKCENDTVEVKFVNDAENLDEREIDRLFERFYTNDQSRRNGSTGLGLTIARELMRRMNGDLRVCMSDKKHLELTAVFRS